MRDGGAALLAEEGIDFMGFHGGLLCEGDELVTGGPFFLQEAEAVVIGQSERVGAFGESHIGIVLPEQDTVFGAGGKHAVGFIDAFGDEVIDKDADVSFVSSEDKGCSSVAEDMGIDTGHDTLSGGFFVSGGAIDLSGEEQGLHLFECEGVV